MRIRRAFIRWPCLHGSMHLITTTTVPLFHYPSVPTFRHVIRRPCHRPTITPSHLPHHSTVPPATNMPNRVAVRPGATPCHHRATVPPACHLLHHRNTVPPGALPCHLMIHCATSSATMPPCRRLTYTTHRHTYVHPRTWLLSIIPPNTVWRNFTIWSVAKNRNDYYPMF